MACDYRYLRTAVPKLDYVTESEEEDCGDRRCEARYADHGSLHGGSVLNHQALLLVCAIIDHDNVQVLIFTNGYAASKVTILRLSAVIVASFGEERRVRVIKSGS